MLKGTFARAAVARTVRLSQPQADVVTAAFLPDETPDEALFRLVRQWLENPDESISSIPTGKELVDYGDRKRWKSCPRVLKLSGQLAAEDDTILSSIIYKDGATAQQVLETWVTCAAQLQPAEQLSDADAFYHWITETYDPAHGAALEAVLYECWGRVSYNRAIALLQQLKEEGRIYLYAWPKGSGIKQIKLPNGERPSWLELQPRPQR